MTTALIQLTELSTAPALAALRIAVILVTAWVAISISHRTVKSLRMRITARMEDREAVQRAATLGRALRYVASVVITLVAGMLVLSELGISLAPLLGAAGVAGLAIGFGAQELVKDYFAGLTLLLEDQIRQGDVVKLGDHAGVVEEITLRYVRLRDYDGNVHFMRNGAIPSVVSMGRGHACAVIDVGVAYGSDLDHVMGVMHRVAEELAADPEHCARIVGAFEMAGVEAWADSSVVIRCRFKVAPLEQWTIRRAYLKRLKMAFDNEGIEIPFPHVHLVQTPPVASKSEGVT